MIGPFEPIRGRLNLTPSERLVWRARLARMTREEQRDLYEWAKAKTRESKNKAEVARRVGEAVARRCNEKIMGALTQTPRGIN